MSIQFNISGAYATHMLNANNSQFEKVSDKFLSVYQGEHDKNVDTVSISTAARNKLNNLLTEEIAEEDVVSSIQRRLNDIKAKNAISRTEEESQYLRSNDKRFTEISASGKSPNQLTAADLEYMQTAGGFVNLMQNLTPAETELYDNAITNSDSQAVEALSLVALIRAGGQIAGGENGNTYNPFSTEITAENIDRYFRHSIVDISGRAESNFEALKRFLQGNLVAN